MTSQFSQTDKIEKIKTKLDLSLVSKFDIKELESDVYIPLCNLKGAIVVIAEESSLPDRVKNVIYSVTGNSDIKVANVSSIEFTALLDYVKSNLHIEMPSENQEIKYNTDSDSDIKLKYDDEMDEDFVSIQAPEDADNSSDSSADKYSTMKIGEVLVKMGLVTNEQIFNALVESKKSHIPLGTILVQQSVITLDDLKKALVAQQGYEAVTEEQLKISDNVLSMLPEDFIKINKVIPISYNDKVLVVGMVNPNDIFNRIKTKYINYYTL